MMWDIFVALGFLIFGTRNATPKQLLRCFILFPLAILLMMWVIMALGWLIVIFGGEHDRTVYDAKIQMRLDSPLANDGTMHHLRNRGRLSNEGSSNYAHQTNNMMLQQSKRGSSNYVNHRNNEQLRPLPQHHDNIPYNNIEVPVPYHPPSHLISRDAKVTISSSTRGNLGPASVINQNPPGTDWIKDRWQAASDMGGTAIPGSHWVLMDFTNFLQYTPYLEEPGYGSHLAVYVDKIVLDWETAFAKDYRIEGRLAAPPLSKKNAHGKLSADDDDGQWCILYDGALDSDTKRAPSNDNTIYNGSNNNSNNQPHRSVKESGQSPGVKQKLPLHIVHTLDWTNNEHRYDESDKCHRLRYLRIFIRKPARGWGVSLWQVDVFGSVVPS